MTETVEDATSGRRPEGPDPAMRLRQTAGLFGAVLKREAIFRFRYPVNTLGGLAVSYVFFLMIFFGGRAVGGARFDDSLGAVIVGYFLWTMATTAYQSLANQVTNESQWGTLERLYMSPVGFGRVMAMLAVANIGFGVLWGLVTLALMLLTTGETVAVDVLSVAPVVVLAIMPVLGIGFVFGGAALRYKRVEQVFNLIQFAFIGLIAAPVQEYPVLKALPLTQGSHVLRLVMAEGEHLWTLPPTELGILFAVAVGYFLAGYAVFARATDWARDAGVMGHY